MGGAHGYILVSYRAACAYYLSGSMADIPVFCHRSTELESCHSASEAAKLARAKGWVKTRKRSWVCPACREREGGR